jgi:hypothetical protein
VQAVDYASDVSWVLGNNTLMPIFLSRKECYLPIIGIPLVGFQLVQSTNLTIIVSLAVNLQGSQGLSRRQTTM